MKKILNRNKSSNSSEIRIFNRKMPKLQNLFRRKPDFDNDEVDYEISCSDCDQVHIVQTE